MKKDFIPTQKFGLFFIYTEDNKVINNNKQQSMVDLSQILLTGMPLSISFGHERAPFQRSLFGRSTVGNDVVATIFIRLFLFFPPFFSPSRPFLIEGVLGSKNLFRESCLERPKT